MVVAFRFGEHTSLTQPSPQGEGFHVSRASEKSRDWIGRMRIRKTRISQWSFPLPGGEDQGEGGRNPHFAVSFVLFFLKTANRYHARLHG